MYQKSIKDMNFEELRNALYEKSVQLAEMQDELARFKRDIYDMLENLDDSNFSSTFLKEKSNMKSQIAILPEMIKTSVSESIDISEAIEITQNPNDATGLDTEQIYMYNDNGEYKYYYYNSLSKKWELVTNASIYSVFEQKSDGFYLKGNVVIDGNNVTIKNLTFDGDALLVQYSADGSLWHDEYNSLTDVYMRLSTDNGTTWGETIKITAKDGENGKDGKDGSNGTNGKDGKDGSDATVTAKNVFDAIMSSTKDKQGLFSSFYDDENKLFINAEYIRSGTLAGMKFTDYANAIGSLTLNNNSIIINGTTHSNAANMTLATTTTGQKYFVVADAKASNNKYLTYLIIHDNIIGWGDDTAFNPTGTWNFSEAKLDLTGATLSGTKMNIELDSGVIEMGVAMNGGTFNAHQGSDIILSSLENPASNAKTEINMNSSIAYIEGTQIYGNENTKIDLGGANVFGNMSFKGAVMDFDGATVNNLKCTYVFG